MNRLYVLVREDLPIEYQAVQAGHAVAAWTLDFPKKWKNEYLIYLSVKSENDLKKWASKLERNDMDFRVFYEPDIDEYTALSTLSDKKLFNKLNALGKS